MAILGKNLRRLVNQALKPFHNELINSQYLQHIMDKTPEGSKTTRRLSMLRHHGVNTVLDVGANTGQYALALRRAGYEQAIFSFEPLSDAFGQLERKSRSDPNWRVFHCA